MKPRAKGSADIRRGALVGAEASRAKAPDARAALSRFAFYSHLWVGVIFTTALVVISVTGVLLNHKRGLGLMPDVVSKPSVPFAAALPLAHLARVALEHASTGGTEYAERDIDRMDVRPRSGYVKVRLRNAASTEVTVDIGTGDVLHMGRRGDVFLEKLHSGEAFGGIWVLISDAAAVALVLVCATGYWLWLAPRLRRGGARGGGA